MAWAASAILVLRDQSGRFGVRRFRRGDRRGPAPGGGEESIGQGDGVEGLVRVVEDRRVDEELDGPARLLTRIERLLVEAEAGDLVEIDARRAGTLNEAATPEVPAAARFSEQERRSSATWPRWTVISRCSGRKLQPRPLPTLASKRTVIVRSDALAAVLGLARGAAEAGQRAEDAIERDGGEGGADHGGDEDGAGGGGKAEAGAIPGRRLAGASIGDHGGRARRRRT